MRDVEQWEVLNMRFFKWVKPILINKNMIQYLMSQTFMRSGPVNAVKLEITLVARVRRNLLQL